MQTPAVAGDLFGADVDTASAYAHLLASRGVEWGLIGPREVDRIWERHVLNSVAVSALVPEDATVVDVGSGAGLPGIPLAIARVRTCGSRCWSRCSDEPRSSSRWSTNWVWETGCA